jgi:hypothetical protein
MYTTCLFCNGDLGRNESIEALPVGCRLAFDGDRGRLWVVCRKCERWNLTPFEERWEALEECERLYRGTRLRVSTDNIGLAKLRDGLELVRVGAALRPEFAAWRYGDQFGRRRRRQILIAGGGLALLGGVVLGGAAAGVGVASFGGVMAQAIKIITRGRAGAVVARVPTGAGVLPVQRKDLSRTAIVASGQGAPFALEIRLKERLVTLDGREATRAAGMLLPAANRFGGAASDVQSAVRRIENAGDPSGFLARVAVAAAPSRAMPTRRSKWEEMPKTGLFALGTVERLAIEMALQEDAERRAMEGELADLEAAWRQAEEIAAIADNLLVEPGGARAVDALKHGAR